jgi:hypothetical protein
MFTPTHPNETLVGDYYFAVFGAIESSYHIYYHTERTDKDKDGNVEKVKLPVKLQQRNPVRGVLKSKDDYLLYKFNIGKY